MIKFFLGVCMLTVVSAKLSSDEKTALSLYHEKLVEFADKLINASVNVCVKGNVDFATQCNATTTNCTSAAQSTKDLCCQEEEDDVKGYGCDFWVCWMNCDSTTTASSYKGAVVCAKNTTSDEDIIKDDLTCMTSGKHEMDLGIEKEVNDTKSYVTFNRSEMYAALETWSAKTELEIKAESDATIRRKDDERTYAVLDYLFGGDSYVMTQPLVQTSATDTDIEQAGLVLKSNGGANHIYKPTNHGPMNVTGSGEIMIASPQNSGPILIQDTVSAAVFGGKNTGSITSTSTGYLVVSDLTNSGDVVVTGSQNIWIKNVENSGTITVTNIGGDLQNILNTGTVTVKSGDFVATGIDNSDGTIVIETGVTCDITFISGKEGTLTDTSGACSAKKNAAAPSDYYPGDFVDNPENPLNANYGQNADSSSSDSSSGQNADSSSSDSSSGQNADSSSSDSSSGETKAKEKGETKAKEKAKECLSGGGKTEIECVKIALSEFDKDGLTTTEKEKQKKLLNKEVRDAAIADFKNCTKTKAECLTDVATSRGVPKSRVEKDIKAKKKEESAKTMGTCLTGANTDQAKKNCKDTARAAYKAELPAKVSDKMIDRALEKEVTKEKVESEFFTCVKDASDAQSKKACRTKITDALVAQGTKKNKAAAKVALKTAVEDLVMEAYVGCSALQEANVDCKANAKQMYLENGGSNKTWTKKVEPLAETALKYKDKTIYRRPMARVETSLSILNVNINDIIKARPKFKAAIKLLKTEGCSVKRLAAAAAVALADGSVDWEFFVDLESEACTDKFTSFLQDFDYTKEMKSSIAAAKKRRLLTEIAVESASDVAVETVEVDENGEIVVIETGVVILKDADDGVPTKIHDNGVARALGHPLACLLVVVTLLA